MKSGLDWEEYIRELERWEEKYGNSSILNYCDDVIKNCTLPAVCKKMAEYLGTELISSKDSHEDVYFKFAVLLKRGGENDQALQALTRALALSPDEEKRTMLKTAWDLQLKQ